MNVVRESYDAGDFIFREGDTDVHFYIIEEGQVEVFTGADKSEEISIAKMGPGESFGEFAMLVRAPRSASARAITTVSVVRVSEKGYEELLSQLPDWASCMLKSFADRLRGMNERLKAQPQFLAKK
ncbi:MAG TPA: cyclic nucleotide-binding domain-containing protein [Bdellovibrionales bacterium]|nr:cyclic nucleotide-binding domain-containing protein [Bdellovibrionales bacterium]